MEKKPNLPFFPILYTGLAAAIIGWLGLAYVILMTDPELGPRWLFFFLLFLALSGTAMPGVAYLNRRFASDPPAGEAVIIRQSGWIGIYGAAIAWLQLGRMLSLVLALVIALALVLFEILWRLSERSRWKPQDPDHE